MTKRVIAVFGATGDQGGPIARALLQSGFEVRAVTRNPSSEKGQALKAAGAEVVKGDLNDVESLRTVLRGAYGVFYITNVMELFMKDPTAAFHREVEQGKAVADACKAASTQHIIFSGMDPVKEKTGKPVPNMDSRAAVEKYLDEIGVPNTSVRYPWYYENFIGFFAPTRQDDGTYALTLPMDGPLDAMSVADGAHVVVAAFQNPQDYIGKKVGLSADKKPISDYMATISSVTGKTVRYNQVSFDEYRQQVNNPMVDALAGTFEYYSYGGPSYNVEFTRRVYPGIPTFQQWAEKNKEALIKLFSS